MREARKEIIDQFQYDNSQALAAADLRLVEHAKSGILLKYEHGWHQVYAVGVDSAGNVFEGMQQDQPSGDASICAEPFAIHEATMQKRTVVTIVAVRRQRPDEGTEAHVVSPCGTCRLRMMHHNPDISVIVWIGGKINELRKISIDFLYPLPTKQRQRNGNGLASHSFGK